MLLLPMAQMALPVSARSMNLRLPIWFTMRMMTTVLPLPTVPVMHVSRGVSVMQNERLRTSMIDSSSAEEIQVSYM